MELDDHSDFCLFDHGEQCLKREGTREARGGRGFMIKHLGLGDDRIHDERRPWGVSRSVS